MEIVNQLKELKKWRTKIDQLESQIEYCVEQSNKITGPIYGEEKINVQSSNKAPYERWIWKKLDLEKELKEYQVKFEDLAIRVTDEIISVLKDGQILKVILYREVSFMKFTEIADKLSISKSYVYRLHNIGMSEISKQVQ